MMSREVDGFTIKAPSPLFERWTREWVRAPDGHVLLDRFGYERWVVRLWRTTRSAPPYKVY